MIHKVQVSEQELASDNIIFCWFGVAGVGAFSYLVLLSTVSHKRCESI